MADAKKFSITVDNVSYSMQELQDMGVKKLEEMRSVYKKERNNAPLNGFVVNALVVGSLAYSLVNKGMQLFQDPSNSEVLFAAFLFMNAEQIIRTAFKRNREAKALDKAVVMVSGDMALSEFSSTRKSLVDQGFFSRTYAGSGAEYKCLLV